MADNNPANFANLPKDKLKDIASKGGHASHGGGNGGSHQSEVRPTTWTAESVHEDIN
jgi:hypothetical protein